MFYTVFIYESNPEPIRIIHPRKAIPYAEDMAKYEDYFEVYSKPTLKDAEVIFRICKPNDLCAGIKSAKTEKLK